jgi:hypothetical protein
MRLASVSQSGGSLLRRARLARLGVSDDQDEALAMQGVIQRVVNSNSGHIRVIASLFLAAISAG